MNSKPVLVQLSTTSSRSSYSSLSSEDVTFDHTASPSEAESGSGKERTLGLRQLASMALSEGKPSTVTSEPPPRIELRKALGPEPESAPFAKDVKIKGWKTVGGKSWTDRAKVGAYVVYDIEINLRNGGTINILRRYMDFVHLRSALKLTYPHLHQAIPKLPGKGHMSKFAPSFLADRQPRLQRFLRTVMLHPEMGRGGKGSVVGQWVLGEREGAVG